MNKRDNYIELIGTMFMKYGFKTVSVDDIARELSISKKTLYQEFKDKSEIIEEVINSVIQDYEECYSEKTAISAETAIDELIIIIKKGSKRIANFQPSVLFELRKYYPECWKRIESHKEERTLTFVKNNIERGVKEGIYRKNININIISNLFVRQMNLLVSQDKIFEEEYSFEEVYFEMMRYHIRGVASEKGIIRLKEIIKKEKINLL